MKCFICRKKLNKLYKPTQTCRCNKVFCNTHKTNHECSFDYVKNNQHYLEENLVKLESNHGLHFIC